MERAFKKKEAMLIEKPGFVKYVEKLEKSIMKYPMRGSVEYDRLDNGKVIQYYTRSIRARSYSKTMIFSKDEIMMRYVIGNDVIVVVGIFFPP
jgi:hypothetical protein